MTKINFCALVSAADLHLSAHPERSEAGLPIGNGRMGTMLSTDEAALHLQLNHADVFAVNRAHLGAQHEQPDYCGGCAAVSVEFGADALRVTDAFSQRLSLYDAEYTLTADEVTVRGFVSSATDVLVLEISDHRLQLQPVRVIVSNWRPHEVVHGVHRAQTTLQAYPETICIAQQFSEGEHYCASAACAGVPEGAMVTVDTAANRAEILLLPARTHALTFSTAASWTPAEDPASAARAALAVVAGQTYAVLHAAHTPWWHAFWSRTFVKLTSDDGSAEEIARLRHLHLYYMACCSRGTLPPKFNGMLFTTAGDTRMWGSQYWLWNTELLYFPLYAADAWELAENYFRMYARMLPACTIAARQRWGLPGIYLPETVPFDGPATLPEDVATEFRAVIRGRLTCSGLSDRARAYGAFCSQLHSLAEKHPDDAPAWALPTGDRFSFITHIVSSAAEVALQAWWRYRYTGEEAWLRESAYPLLRGTVEFYRHLAEMEADGHYHLSGINAHESYWGARDSTMDLAAIRGIIPLALRAAEKLGLDAESCRCGGFSRPAHAVSAGKGRRRSAGGQPCR